MVVKKNIQAHAALGLARHTLSTHAPPNLSPNPNTHLTPLTQNPEQVLVNLFFYSATNCTKLAPFSRRAIPPQCPANVFNKTMRVLLYTLPLARAPGGSPRVLAGRPPAPCGVAPWLRRAPSVVCGCTITEMGHTHDPYGGVRHLVLCAPEPVGCRPSVSRPLPCAPVRAREPNGARGHREPKNRC